MPFRQRLTCVINRQGVGFVTLAAAFLAGYLSRRQEVHFDQLQAGALAGLATPSLNVEGKSVGLESADFCIGRGFEEAADVGHHLGVGRGVAAGRTADRRLVYLDDLVDISDAFNALVRQHGILGAIEFVADDRHQRLVDQG